MKLYNLYLIFLLLNVFVASGQTTNMDSIEFEKKAMEFEKYLKENTPKLSFDSARFSTNGKYALIHEGSYINGCIIHYWSLYNSGLNKPIEEYVAIIKDSVYFITYDDKNRKDSLIGIQRRGNKITWGVSKKYDLNKFIESYDLTVKPIDLTDKLIIRIDTLPRIKKVIPWESNLKTINHSEEVTAYILELKFLYMGKILFKDTVTYLPDPNEDNFNTYLVKIQKQVLNKVDSDSDWGKYFLVYGNNFFLSLYIESFIFSGYECNILEDGQCAMSWGSRPDYNSRFKLFK